MMQYLVGRERDGAASRSRWGSQSSKYILDQDPGLTLTLGSVPVNLTNMTGAYGVFAAAGRAASADRRSWRSATGRQSVIYDLKKNGPEAVTSR